MENGDRSFHFATMTAATGLPGLAPFLFGTIDMWREPGKPCPDSSTVVAVIVESMVAKPCSRNGASEDDSERYVRYRLEGAESDCQAGRDST
jgi:hypothetical protein